jgi:hypothetical protein
LAGSRAAARLRRPDTAHLTAVATGLVALAVYRATLLPGVAAWDTGEAQAVLPTMGTMHPTGFPAYVVLGWLTTHVLAPLGSPAFLVNLLSAILVSVAVGTTVLVTRRLGVHLAVGAAVALGSPSRPSCGASRSRPTCTRCTSRCSSPSPPCCCAGGPRRHLAEAPDRRLRARADRAILLAAGVFGVALANHALAALLLIPPSGCTCSRSSPASSPGRGS